MEGIFHPRVWIQGRVAHKAAEPGSALALSRREVAGFRVHRDCGGSKKIKGAKLNYLIFLLRDLMAQLDATDTEGITP